MIGFLRRYWLPTFLIVLLLAQVGQAYLLRRALSNERLSQDLARAAIEAARTKQPVNVTVTTPAGPPITVTVRGLEPIIVPGLAPRVVVEAPPIPCRTEEECRRIYGAAEQAITVTMELMRGTVLPVCLADLVNGLCPPEQVANRPLAAAFPLDVRLVRLTGGAFSALAVPGSPLRITEVSTATRPIEVAPRASQWPYNLFLKASVVSGSVFTGAAYRNWGLSGAYEVGIGYGWPGLAAYVGFEFPLR